MGKTDGAVRADGEMPAVPRAARKADKGLIIFVSVVAGIILLIIVATAGGIGLSKALLSRPGEDTLLAKRLGGAGWIHDASSGLFWKWVDAPQCGTAPNGCAQVLVESVGPGCPAGVTVRMNLHLSSGEMAGTAESTDSRELPVGQERVVQVTSSLTKVDQVQMKELVCRA
ncbi:hypothetical protein [Arthrobacter sp. NyZ413]|uniref:hypothetical protein n=1 Tax=Arthrobacter sp. NyZ413 TaxID=3144669 RepID=UPI003BF897E8